MLRLRDCRPGDTVVLSGDQPARKLFLAITNTDGYRFLWNSREDFVAGKPWVVMAAGSHHVSSFGTGQ